MCDISTSVGLKIILTDLYSVLIYSDFHNVISKITSYMRSVLQIKYAGQHLLQSFFTTADLSLFTRIIPPNPSHSCHQISQAMLVHVTVYRPVGGDGTLLLSFWIVRVSQILCCRGSKLTHCNFKLFIPKKLIMFNWKIYIFLFMIYDF